jgi:Domain of unknown function (DUF4326)
VQDFECQAGWQSINGKQSLCRTAIEMGNPFAFGRDGSRSEVISKYRCWVGTQTDLMDTLDELRGKDLICWCAPLACHAEVLRDLANS